MEEIKYEIPGNNGYILSIKGKDIKLISKKDKPEILPENNKLTLALYNEIYTLDIEWLLNYCRYKVELPRGYEHHLTKIEFHEYNLKSHGVKYEHIPIFNTPVLYAKDNSFRVVAAHPYHAVNSCGDVVNITNGKVTKYRVDVNKYGRVAVKDSLNPPSSTTLIHRLVAMAWVENDSYVSKPIVDHKDGDKSNPHKDNLEWVSFAENNRRAAVQGLKTDNINVKVYDYKESKEYIFGSMTQACEFMGRSRINRLEEFCSRNFLINDRYQIKLLSDTSDWDFNSLSGATKYKVTIDGVTKGYSSIRKLVLALLPDRTKQAPDVLRVAIALEGKYPGCKLEFPDNMDTKCSYSCTDITNGKVYENKSRRELSDITGMSVSSVDKGINLGERFSVSGYRFKRKSNTAWCKVYKEIAPITIPIVATRVSTGDRREFSSIRKAAKYIGVDKKFITPVINTGTSLKGYLISKATQ